MTFKTATGILAASLLFIMGMDGVAQAQTKIKIGYVDLERAIYETEDGKKTKLQLEGIFKKKQDELKKKQDDLERSKAD